MIQHSSLGSVRCNHPITMGMLTTLGGQGMKLFILPIILLFFILPDHEFYPVVPRFPRPYDPHRPPRFDGNTIRLLYLNAIRRLTTAGYNFSHIGEGLRLVLRGKLLNKRNLKLTTADAMDILPMLHDQTFQDRMYVWGKTAAVCAFTELAAGRNHKTYPVNNLDKFEGDIILDRDSADRIVSEFPFGSRGGQIYQLTSGQILHGIHRAPTPSKRFGNHRVKRKMVSTETKYWSGVIPWKIVDPAFSIEEVEVIRSAFEHWEELTCIRFEEITDPALNFTIANDPIESRRISVQQAVAEANLTRRIFLGKANMTMPDLTIPAMSAPIDGEENIGSHLQFKRGQGCYSYTGKFGNNGQEVSIGEGCAYMGIVSHEIGHAIGFYHEQNRPDRDVYISINASNIKDFHMRDFNIYTWEQVITDAIPYDYSSLMHYGTAEWSKNNKPTIITKDSKMQKVLGQREKLSFLDTKLANFQFCSVSCGQPSLEWSACKHGGYRNPNQCDNCVCPPGWAPPTCTDIEPGRNTNCGDQHLYASPETQTLESPSYESGVYERNIFCAWLIKAPPGKRIKVEVNEEFDYEDSKYTCEDYVEIRYEGVERTGPRLCSPENTSHVFISLGHEVMVLMNTIRRSTRGFKATYAITDGCGGCSGEVISLTEPLCQRVEKYNCSGTYYSICENGRPCAKLRDNYCFRKVDFCCDPYEKDDDVCKFKAWGPARDRGRRKWTEWTEWTPCSATCGGCGKQIRERQCLDPPCTDDAVEVRPCAMKMCPAAVIEVTKKCKVTVQKQCNWNWWGFLPCYTTRYQTCTDSFAKKRCCEDFIEDDQGECKLEKVDLK